MGGRGFSRLLLLCFYIFPFSTRTLILLSNSSAREPKGDTDTLAKRRKLAWKFLFRKCCFYFGGKNFVHDSEKKV
jgi:hypothetical protein